MDINVLEKYMTVTVAAQKLGCVRTNLHYHIKVGNLKAVFLGNIGEWLIHKDELQIFEYSSHFNRKQAKGENEDE